MQIILDALVGKEMPPMTATRRIVLSVSPELLEQLDMMATEQNLDIPTFCRHAIRSELSRLNDCKTARHSSTERTPTHAAHP